MILLLDISFIKKTAILLYIYCQFSKACKLTVLLGCFNLFHQLGFASTRFGFSGIAITNLLASKKFLDTV